MSFRRVSIRDKVPARIFVGIKYDDEPAQFNPRRYEFSSRRVADSGDAYAKEVCLLILVVLQDIIRKLCITDRYPSGRQVCASKAI